MAERSFNMFRLTDYTNKSYTPFSLVLSSKGIYGDGDANTNYLNVGFGKWLWIFEIPQLIKPKMKQSEYNKEVMLTIPTQYGITWFEESILIHYGQQPGCWIRDDPDNSDKVKVINSPLQLHHVRWDAYFADGEYACSGEYLRDWIMSYHEDKPYNADTRNIDFQTVPLFKFPDSDNVATDKPIFRFYNITDPFDGAKTVARVNIEEREWIRGKWNWLRRVLKHVPLCRLVRRYINIEFRDEVGKRKTSWKGGIVGMSFDMYPTETIDQCCNRFVKSQKFKNL